MSTLSDEIIKIVEDKSNNNPAPISCKITKIVNGYVQVITDTGAVMNNLQVLGNPTPNTDGVIAYLDGSYDYPLVIPSTDETTNTILALGLGLFKIKSDGHLYVELPNGISNFFEIDGNGHLLVTLPTGATNDYALNTNDKHLYFDREEF